MYKILDNFFENPYEIRQVALNLLAENHSCILNEGKNYPGIRCSVPNYIREYIIEFLEKSFSKKVEEFLCDFHITSATHRLGLVHNDRESYAGLIYLNENPPKHSGTILCNSSVGEHSIIEDDIVTAKKFQIASSTHDVEIITEFANYKEQYNKNFNIEIELENKFNRFVLYEGARLHAPYYYFGNNLYNSRLVLVFWFEMI